MAPLAINSINSVKPIKNRNSRQRQIPDAKLLPQCSTDIRQFLWRCFTERNDLFIKLLIDSGKLKHFLSATNKYRFSNNCL